MRLYLGTRSRAVQTTKVSHTAVQHAMGMRHCIIGQTGIFMTMR